MRQALLDNMIDTNAGSLLGPGFSMSGDR